MKRRDFNKAFVYTAYGLVVPAHVVAAPVFLGVSPPSGPPTIDSLSLVTGNLNHGSTIRINGSGFGAKPQAAPLYYDPLTAYSNEDLATDEGFWVEILVGGTCEGTGLSIAPKFLDNATGGAPLMGAATTSLFQNQDHQKQAVAMKTVASFTTAPLTEAYVSYQLYQDLNKANWADNTDPIPNTKIYWLYANTSWAGTTGRDMLGINHTGSTGHGIASTFGCPAVGGSDPDDLTGNGSSPAMGNDGVWARQEGYKKESAPGVKDGRVYIRVDDRIARTTNGTVQRAGGDPRPSDGIEDFHYGLPNSPVWQNTIFPNGVRTVASGCAGGHINSFCFGVTDTPNSSTPNCDGTTEMRRRNPDHRPTKYYVSELYADDTGARIEALPDSSAFETNAEGEQIRLIQIPTAWSDSEIEFTINKSRQYDSDISSYYIGVWGYPNMEISNLVQLSTAA